MKTANFPWQGAYNKQKATCKNLITEETFDIKFYCIEPGNGYWRVVDVTSKWGYVGRVIKKFRHRVATPFLFKDGKRSILLLVHIDDIINNQLNLGVVEKTALEMSEILDTWKYPNESIH